MSLLFYLVDTADLTRVHAAAETATTSNDASTGSPLGLVPHQLRGMLGQWKTMLIEGQAYDKCTACSSVVSHLRLGTTSANGQVVEEYKKEGFKMMLRAFNDTDYLEKLTGLDELHKESEAIMDDVDWDEGSEGSF
jgi:ubiquitin-like modifier-activating enzyme ATG7